MEEVALEAIRIGFFVGFTFLLHAVGLQLELLLDHITVRLSHFGVDFSKRLAISLSLAVLRSQALRCFHGVGLCKLDEVSLEGNMLSLRCNHSLPFSVVLQLVFDLEHL